MTGRIQSINFITVGLIAFLLLGTSGLNAANAQPPEPEMCVPAPERVSGLAWDGQHFWVSTNPFSGVSMIHQLEPTTGQLLTSFPAPSEDPSGLTHDGRFLWAVDQFEAILYQINPTTRQVVRQISTTEIFLEGLTWDGSALWSLTRNQTMVRIDPADGAVLRTLPAPSNSQRLAWDGLHLWVAEFVETFKIDPLDGGVFESVREGTISGLTLDGTNLISADVISDEICRIEIDTSPGVSATILPVSTSLLLSQTFDAALLVKTPTADVTVTRAVISIDGQVAVTFPPDPMSPLPPPFANCLIPGTITSREAQTFRCPGLSGSALEAGSHTITAEVALSDGQVLTDTALWIVLEATEP